MYGVILKRHEVNVKDVSGSLEILDRTETLVDLYLDRLLFKIASYKANEQYFEGKNNRCIVTVEHLFKIKEFLEPQEYEIEILQTMKKLLDEDQEKD